MQKKGVSGLNYDEIVKTVPSIPHQLKRFEVAFSKVRLVPNEKEKFNAWIQIVVDSYKKAKSSSSSSKSSSSTKAGAGIPKVFRFLYTRIKRK